ncbi:hypothetical protein RSAG8_03117, partial [Rhizoctonia solani AG-8 WAC10335]
MIYHQTDVWRTEEVSILVINCSCTRREARVVTVEWRESEVR